MKMKIMKWNNNEMIWRKWRKQIMWKKDNNNENDNEK